MIPQRKDSLRLSSQHVIRIPNREDVLTALSQAHNAVQPCVEANTQGLFLSVWPAPSSSSLARHQRSVDPTCSGSLKAGIPYFDQQEERPQRQLKAVSFYEGCGCRKPDGVLLPTQPRSRLGAFLDALKWHFMGNLWVPGSSEVYGWPINTLLLVRKLPHLYPLFKPIPQFTSSPKD